jgi:Dor1-like family
MPAEAMSHSTSKQSGVDTALQPGTARKSATDFLADEYLARLLSYSVDTLSKEPAALQSQKDALKQEILDTALTHYQGFIEAASCFQEISVRVQQLKNELTGLSDCVDNLQEQASSFGTIAQAYEVNFAAALLRLRS